MKRFIILSLLLLGVTGNNGYSMEVQDNDSDINSNNSTDSYSENNNATPYSNSKKFNNHLPDNLKQNNINNNIINNFEIPPDEEFKIDDNNINNMNIHNPNNINNGISEKELEDFEAWSYKKLEELNNMYCNKKAEHDDKRLLEELKNNIKMIQNNYNSSLFHNIKANYKNFITEYLNNTFYQGYGVFGSQKTYMKQILDNKDPEVIDEILNDNIHKFIYHHCNNNNIKQKILEKYLVKYTNNNENDLYRILKEALVYMYYEHQNMHPDEYDTGSKLFEKFKHCFDEVMSNNAKYEQEFKEEFLKIVKHMIATKWIINENIIKYVEKYENKNKGGYFYFWKK